MEKIKDLGKKLDAISDRDFGAYQSLKGEYQYSKFKLYIDQIPKDPYAPSHTGIYRVILKNNFIDQLKMYKTKISKVAFCDFLARNFYQATVKKSKGRRGTGNSGLITIGKPEQVILERNSVLIKEDFVEIRFFMGLPASGRKINSKICKIMFFEELPEIIELALSLGNFDLKALHMHIKTVEDAEYLRAKLDALNLEAFIANNAVLPRKSGTSDEPLSNESVVVFKSPESLLVEINLPHSGKVKGMGVPQGITLIVGGGYHGKSTLLKAIEMGVYNHIPEDGRELCISNSNAVKVRAYSGRYVEKVDITPFINNLPFEKDSTSFSTENASGSTSQAASIIETIEAGGKILLMDEDTCATNFMIRDQKMQKLVHKDDEPITTFIDRIESLYLNQDISTILVLGGIGDYFDVSNVVIQMKDYIPVNVTKRAKEISDSASDKRKCEGEAADFFNNRRLPVKNCISPLNTYNKKSIYAKEKNRIYFGKNIIDLTDTEQLIELSQTKAIAEAILYINRFFDEKTSLIEAVNKLMKEIKYGGLDVISSRSSGNFAQFRAFELAFAINRNRDLKIL